MLAALASALLSVTALGGQPAPDAPTGVEATVAAHPALYAIADGDTTIYLFGTFHVLDANVRWFDGSVARAFEAADELVVETVPPERPPRQRRPLPSCMTPVTPSASFLATTQDAVRAGNAQGMNLAAGADMVLLGAAAERGKPVEPLETLQSQFAMLSRIPNERAKPVPAPTAADTAGRADALNRTMSLLETAWANGEQEVFAAMLAGMRETSPAAYRIMFAERNARWSDWVAARMRSPGTVFVAVGAGHLAGPESLLLRLAQRGLVSRRIH